MKKSVFCLLMLAFASMTTMCFTSCGDDPDVAPPPPTEKGTKILFSPVMYVGTSTLEYFDVEVKDATGTTVKLTQANTQPVDSLVNAMWLIGVNTSILTKVGNDLHNSLRTYTPANEWISSFPASRGYTMTAVYNGTPAPSDSTKITVLAVPVAQATPDKGGFDALAGTTSCHITSLRGKNLTQIEGRKFTNSISFTFDNANSVEVNNDSVGE